EVLVEEAARAEHPVGELGREADLPRIELRPAPHLGVERERGEGAVALDAGEDARGELARAGHAALRGAGGAAHRMSSSIWPRMTGQRRSRSFFKATPMRERRSNMPTRLAISRTRRGTRRRNTASAPKKRRWPPSSIGIGNRFTRPR